MGEQYASPGDGSCGRVCRRMAMNLLIAFAPPRLRAREPGASSAVTTLARSASWIAVARRGSRHEQKQDSIPVMGELDAVDSHSLSMAVAAVSDAFDGACWSAGVLVQTVLYGVPGKRHPGEFLGGLVDLAGL
jgi:hypothetical protein